MSNNIVNPQFWLIAISMAVRSGVVKGLAGFLRLIVMIPAFALIMDVERVLAKLILSALVDSDTRARLYGIDG